MQGFKRLALVAAVSSLSTGAFAELQLLDDAGLQSVTGQSGITIDVESQWEIGEFAYQDDGFLVIQGIRMGGNAMGSGTGSGSALLDNLRLDIDVAGATPIDNELAYGFSSVTEIADLYVNALNADTVYSDIAAGIDSTRGNAAIDTKKVYGDGDLVIHFDFSDAWANEGGFGVYNAANRFATDDYATTELILEHAVDFRLEIDGIGLASSSYVIGSAGLDTDSNHTSGTHEGAAGTTTLISQLAIQGYLGPEDLHIQNNGNGFSGGPNGLGTGDADSKITWGSYFRITDLDVYIDIAGVQITDMEVHNLRGDRTGLDNTSSFDFAHSIREIYAVKDSVLNLSTLPLLGGTTLGSNTPGYVDGVAINTRFKGDIDIGAISFGDSGTSIGRIYITDMESTTNWTISAH